VDNNRPINLDLTTIRFPIPAIASIFHRISGVVLFLFIPVMLWMLQQVMGSEAQFDQMKTCLGSIWFQWVLWGGLTALSYHLIAGIRHLLMDMDIGETLKGGRIGAWIVIVLALICSFLIGAGLWLGM